MIKEIYFDKFRGKFWPNPPELASFFLAPAGRQWSYLGGNDGWLLDISGMYNTGHLKTYFQDPENFLNTQVESHLTMWGNPRLGVLLYYQKVGGGYSEDWFSVGDLGRLDQWVETLHGDRRPVGLYIPFRAAWPAVKEYMDRDGELPKCIEWISTNDLPPNTFPDPGTRKPITFD